jgi:chemotaxis protein MotA
MDVATLAGIVVGIVCLAAGIIYRGSSPEAFSAFVNLPSALLVLGGTFGALLLAVPIQSVMNAGRVALKALWHRRPSMGAIVEELVRYAELARREGILALESAAENARNPFLSRALTLAVDGTDPEQIREILAGELEAIGERHAAGRRVFDILAKYAPAWGMIGTVVGLILMLSQLKDPGSIGPGMSIALVTTFYGAVLSYFVFGPIAEKLQERSDEEIALKEIMLRGVMAIQSGDNPRIVRQKLKAYLPPRMMNRTAW